MPRLIRVQPSDFADSFEHQGTKRPYPYYIEPNGTARVGHDKPGKLIGFQADLAIKQVDLRFADWIEGDLLAAIGMYLVVCGSDGSFYSVPGAVMSIEEVGQPADLQN